MAMYIAEKIMNNSRSYREIFSISIYKKYQEDVNIILIGEGKEDLIVEGV